MVAAKQNFKISWTKITVERLIWGGVNCLVKLGCSPNCKASKAMYITACRSSCGGADDDDMIK